MVTFLKKVAIPSGTESSCGSPTRPTAPPGRAMWSAVKVDSSRPTHSRTECAPRPSVSSRTYPDRLVAALADDVRRAELHPESDPVGIAAEEHDPLGAEPPRRDYAAQTDGAVSDDGHGLSWADIRGDGGVVACSHHVREREQRRHQRVVGGDRQPDQRPVRLRHAHGFALSAVDVVEA